MPVDKRIRTLSDIVRRLRQGESFSVTRLTSIKSLCRDQRAASEFSLHLGQLCLRKMKGRCPRHLTPSKHKLFRELAESAVSHMEAYNKRRSERTKRPLVSLLSKIERAQDQYERHAWGAVRVIESQNLLAIENALSAILYPLRSSNACYKIARCYVERYEARHGTGLVPSSAEPLQEIVDFWSTYLDKRA